MAEMNSDQLEFPQHQSGYEIITRIDSGEGFIVYKAVCKSVNSFVAIKCIDSGRNSSAKTTTSYLSHVNILSAYCCFYADDGRLWVVMPFLSCGSVQSVVSFEFSNGISERCIAAILKQALKGVSYLHSKLGHAHGDVNAANLLMHDDGTVKLANCDASSSSTATSSFGVSKPYWVAPEVVDSQSRYGQKGDIWSIGVTALELAHGGPPLSDIPPSGALLENLTKRFNLSPRSYACAEQIKTEDFSGGFKKFVGLCLGQDPSKRPSADDLLKHSFFKESEEAEFLAKNLRLRELPGLEDRLRALGGEKGKGKAYELDREWESRNVSDGRITAGWRFNPTRLVLEPVFPTELGSNLRGKSVVPIEPPPPPPPSSSSSGVDVGTGNMSSSSRSGVGAANVNSSSHASSSISSTARVIAPIPNRRSWPIVRRSLHEQLSELPDPPTSEEYAETPVEGYGAALLAGYGWTPGRGIGLNNVEDIVVQVRPRRNIQATRYGLGYRPPTSPPPQ